MATVRIGNAEVDVPEGGPQPALPFYNRAGDVLYFYADPTVEVFAERIDDTLTLYRTYDDEAIVGFAIKGFRTLVRMLVDDVSARVKDKQTAKIVRRLREVLLLLLAKRPPHPEQLEAYVMLLEMELTDQPIPLEALAPTAT